MNEYYEEINELLDLIESTPTKDPYKQAIVIAMLDAFVDVFDKQVRERSICQSRSWCEAEVDRLDIEKDAVLEALYQLLTIVYSHANENDE